MGACISKLGPFATEKSIINELERSMHDPKGLRQSLARHRENTSLMDLYNVIDDAGTGSVGSVAVVMKKMDSKRSTLNSNISGHFGSYLEGSMSGTCIGLEHRKYACKTINASSMSLDEMTEFINEIDILRDLDHPNIVQLFEVLKHNRKIWLVMEFCTGGDLSSRLNEMDEFKSTTITSQILHAVAYMHTRGICHRDIKLENILFETKAKDSPIKLIDFGLSNRFEKGVKFFNTCGTIYTAAPELIIGNGFTEQTDVWSIGCVAYILLSGGKRPFLTTYKELDDEKKLEKLREASLSFGSKWKRRKVSGHAKQFVKACLRKDPGSRWTVYEGFEYVRSEWLPALGKAKSIDIDSEFDVASNSLSCEMVDGIIAFSKFSELKKLILITMAYEMDKQSVKEIRDIFLSLDKNGQGTLNKQEFRIAMENRIDDDEIDILFQSIDHDKSGQIHWNEWLAALLDCHGLVTTENLVETFDRLDSDGKQYITKTDIKLLLGTDFDEKLVDKMISNLDISGEGKIDSKRFVDIMLQ